VKRFDEFVTYLPYYVLVATLFLGVVWLLTLVSDSRSTTETTETDERWRQHAIGLESRRLCEAVCERSMTMEGRLVTSEPLALERFEVSPRSYNGEPEHLVCVCGRRP